MSKQIDDDLPVEGITVLATCCGFRVSFDREPGADKWTLSAGHGEKHVQYVGTRRSVTAFLIGYGVMQIRTTQILRDLDEANQRSILDMMERLGGSRTP